MAMPAPNTQWTAEMARALPDDGNRYEVLDGVLFVSPAPSPAHQRAVFLLCTILDRYTTANDLGAAMISPADIEFSPRRRLQPDVFVVPREIDRHFRAWTEVTTLLLAAEVISPSTARVDRGEKRLILQDERIPEYWIVDLDARIVERWRPPDERPEILSETLLWHPRSFAPALELDLVEYFRSVLGE
ncbi:MAG TPA: Uma2 family endonuclease [Gemmatimonadaceae bacterium]|nr:Uma2 family endonuclease [Gemmatimonadaceae bacterium]